MNNVSEIEVRHLRNDITDIKTSIDKLVISQHNGSLRDVEINGKLDVLLEDKKDNNEYKKATNCRLDILEKFKYKQESRDSTIKWMFRGVFAGLGTIIGLIINYLK